MRLPAITIVAGSLALAGCMTDQVAFTGSTFVAPAEVRVLAEACADHYGSTFARLPGPKAIVAGTDGRVNDCFWVWGRANTAAARDEALSRCEAEFATCRVYATDRGAEPWVVGI